MSNYLVPAICTQCGAQIQVDDSKEAGICPCCDTAFITKKAINNYYSTTNNYHTTNNFIKANSISTHTETIEQLWDNFQTAIKDNNGINVAWKIYTKMEHDYSGDYRSYYAGLLYYARFRSYYNASPTCYEYNGHGDVSCCYTCKYHYSCFTETSSYSDALQLYKDAKALAPSTASQEIDNVWNQFMQNYTSSKQKAITERKNRAWEETKRNREAEELRIKHESRVGWFIFILIMGYVILGICFILFCSLGSAILYFLIGFVIVRFICKKAWYW